MDGERGTCRARTQLTAPTRSPSVPPPRPVSRAAAGPGRPSRTAGPPPASALLSTDSGAGVRRQPRGRRRPPCGRRRPGLQTGCRHSEKSRGPRPTHGQCGAQRGWVGRGAAHVLAVRPPRLPLSSLIPAPSLSRLQGWQASLQPSLALFIPFLARGLRGGRGGEPCRAGGQRGDNVPRRPSAPPGQPPTVRSLRPALGKAWIDFPTQCPARHRTPTQRARCHPAPSPRTPQPRHQRMTRGRGRPRCCACVS